jgi:hypothetical protein
MPRKCRPRSVPELRPLPIRVRLRLQAWVAARLSKLRAHASRESATRQSGSPDYIPCVLDATKGRHMRGFRTRAYVGLRGYSCGRLPQGEICLNPTARLGITDADLGFMKKKTLSDDCLNQQQEKLQNR